LHLVGWIIWITGTGRKCICLSDRSCVNTRSGSQILKYFMTSVHCYVAGESQWRSCTGKHCSSVGCPITEWRSAECLSVCQQSQRFWHSQQQQTKQHPAAGTLSLKSCYCTNINFFPPLFLFSFCPTDCYSFAGSPCHVCCHIYPHFLSLLHLYCLLSSITLCSNSASSSYTPPLSSYLHFYLLLFCLHSLFILPSSLLLVFLYPLSLLIFYVFISNIFLDWQKMHLAVNI